MSTRGRVWIVLGERGSGKTTYACRLAQGIAPAIYVDPTRDAPLPRALPATLRTPGHVVAAALRRGEVVHLGCRARDAKVAATAALEVAIRHRAAVWVDEAHLVHGRGDELPELTEAITAARHYRVDIGLVTQAPQALSAQPLHAGCIVVCFAMPFAGPWARAYGLPQDRLESLAESPAHSYLEVRGHSISGPHRLALGRGA